MHFRNNFKCEGQPIFSKFHISVQRLCALCYGKCSLNLHPMTTKILLITLYNIHSIHTNRSNTSILQWKQIPDFLNITNRPIISPSSCPHAMPPPNQLNLYVIYPRSPHISFSPSRNSYPLINTHCALLLTTLNYYSLTHY